MKKKVIPIITCLLAGGAMVLPGVLSAPNLNKEDVGEIPEEFTEEQGEDLINFIGHPFRAEGESEVATPNKVILHYHNDDNGCLGRRFYTWVTGVDGIERKPMEEGWTSTDMKIELDFDQITDYKDSISLFFIIKVAGTWAGQSEDTELKFEDYEIKDGVLEVWTIPGEGTSIEIYKTEAESLLPKIQTAKFTDFQTIKCVSTVDKDGKKWIPEEYRLYAYDKNYLNMEVAAQAANKEFYLFKTGRPTSSEFNISLNYKAKINIQYVVESRFPGYDRWQRCIVSYEYLYELPRFEEFYSYKKDDYSDCNDLGMTYNGTSATFRVWSPISANVLLNVYENGTPRSLGGSDVKKVYKMGYKPGGIWETTIIESDTDVLAGRYYTFTLTNSNGTVETVDPYVKATGINGIRGFIYDKSSAAANPSTTEAHGSTNTYKWSELPVKWDGVSGLDINTPQDLSIYEIHIRDLTMDNTWESKKGNERGTYKAFAEPGTTYSKNNKTVTTGYSHIEELGVKAIQLLPVFDQDNDERPEKMKFNWGYNPLNYNGVEGGYSSDAYNPLARIREYKELILAYANNANRTRTIMDVVYNHVSSASSSCFSKIMPKYYFRYTSDWSYYDGSGCSNEVKSDAPMMRKFIVESLVWWATEYKIKGFRFDLMGLIDTWTLRAAKERLYEIDPDIVLYGEGWTSGGYHGKYQMNGDTLVEGGAETKLVYSSLYHGQYNNRQSNGQVGGFNNGGRDLTKGGNDDGYNGSPYPTWGYISQGSGDVKEKSNDVITMLKGANPWAGANPAQTINYMSCHDNYTLWDQLRYTLSEGTNSDKTPGVAPSTVDTIQASIACHAAVMLSNGVAFMQGGEELYRTKSYSYNKADLAKLMEGGADAVVRPFPKYVHYSEDPDVIQATSDVYMYGDVITHNSYKSPDYVNSFKWDRKIEINGTDTSGYFETWKTMVRARDNITKVDYHTMWESGDYSNYNAWGGGYGVSLIAGWTRTDSTHGYGFFFAGRSGGSFTWGGISIDSTVFSNGANITKSGDTINVPKYGFICYKLNG